MATTAKAPESAEQPVPQVPVVVALSAAAAEIGSVAKRERNTQQGGGYNFRGVDSVVNACAPAFRKNGIIATPTILSHTYETVEVGQRRTLQAHFTITVEYRFYGPLGDSIAATVLAEAMDSGDKAAAKAMSVAFRIALLQVLALPTDDPDPDYESPERSPHREDVPPDSRPLADDAEFDGFLTEVSSADSMDALRAVGGRMSKYRFSPAHHTALAEAFKTSQARLSGE